MGERNVVILAPHVGDEIIGCYSIIEAEQVKEVVYFFDLTEDAMDRARRFAGDNGHACIFLEDDNKAYEPSMDALVLIPSSMEVDADALYVNAWAKQLKNKELYYSISMNQRPLSKLNATTQLQKEMCYEEYNHKQWRSHEQFVCEYISEVDGEMWGEMTARFVARHKHPGAVIEGNATQGVTANTHRHEFHVRLRVQQYTIVDVDMLTLKDMFTDKVLAQWAHEDIGELTSAGMAVAIRNWAQGLFFKSETGTMLRAVEVNVSEDGENGTWAR